MPVNTVVRASAVQLNMKQYKNIIIKISSYVENINKSIKFENNITLVWSQFKINFIASRGCGGRH